MKNLLILLLIACLGAAAILFVTRTAPASVPKPVPQKPKVEKPEPPLPPAKAPEIPPPVKAATAELQNAPGASQENLTRNNEAIEFLNSERFEESVEIFEELLEKEPEEGVYRGNLAEALTRWAASEYDQLPEESLAKLERALEVAPERTDLKPVLDRWRLQVQAQEGFFEDQSLHFTLQYDGSRADLLTTGYRAVLDDLEAAYQDYGEFFDVFPVEAGQPKFRAVLYDRDAFDTVTGIGEWAGGAYDGTIRVPVRNFPRDRKRIRGTLRHELVHAFIDHVGGRQIPGWLNEGLAQYLAEETAAARENQILNSKRRLGGQSLFTLGALQGTLSGIQDAAEVAKAYDQSLAFTAWLATNYGERVLVQMVQATKQGQDPAKEFQRRIGVTLDVVHGDFANSL